MDTSAAKGSRWQLHTTSSAPRQHRAERGIVALIEPLAKEVPQPAEPREATVVHAGTARRVTRPAPVIEAIDDTQLRQHAIDERVRGVQLRPVLPERVSTHAVRPPRVEFALQASPLGL